VKVGIVDRLLQIISNLLLLSSKFNR